MPEQHDNHAAPQANSTRVFNLLVTALEGAWDRPEYVFDETRVLEYTEPELKKRLKDMGPAARQLLTTVPALFAYETPVGAPARVGWIDQIERHGRRVSVAPRFDEDIEPVPPEKIGSMVWELRISAWEMNRTHWAVKEADLLGLLAGTHESHLDKVPPYRVTGHARTIELVRILVGQESLDAVERAVRDAIEDDRPAEGLDRLHTFSTRFLRAFCQRHGVVAPRDRPLHSLVGEYLKVVDAGGRVESEMTRRILKSTISVMESFNDVRNHQSLAHDNELLNHNEALLIFNHVVNALRFIQELERLSDVAPEE